MKKTDIYLFASAIVLLLSGCYKEEVFEDKEPAAKEPMTFYASMESGADTKTVIEGNVGDDVRYLKWLPEDKIGIYNSDTQKFETFVNVNEEASASAVFEGVNTEQDVYYAVYPYSESHSYNRWDQIMTVNLPTVQHYAAGSFGLDSNPMVAFAEKGKDFYFQNLCGVLVINLTGEVSVKSLAVTLYDDAGAPAPLSGKHTVSMDYIETPTLKSTDESMTSVTLDCGEGVALNSAEPTPFHVVLPAGTYSGIRLSVLTTDGNIMAKHGSTNALKIRRSRVTSAGALQYQSEIDVDLSERGTSNCYVVSEPGVYSFDATVIGNGEFGLIPDAGYHTDTPDISPVSAELLWEDKAGTVQSVFYNEGRIGFYSSGIEGNALIAAKDADGTILWSWHIWATDEPVEQTYVNDTGTYVMLDRNVGATRADRGTGDEWEESIGLHYQWGRKDPFADGKFTVYSDVLPVSEAVKNPNSLMYSYANYTVYNKCWKPDIKTIYDPCPVGYRIPIEDVWCGFTDNGESQYVSDTHVLSTTWDNGWTFYINDASETAWYPATGSYHNSTDRANIMHAYLWSADVPDRNGYYYVSFSYEGYITQNNKQNRHYYAYPVRCMKDEGHVDISLPQVAISGFEDVTMATAKVLVDVKSQGISEVTEKGIIWGMASDLSDGTKVQCGSDIESFSVDLSDLTASTKYYVKPYAVNSRGESYGPIESFRTRYSDTATDLSAEGTANCYIVTYAGTHSFDCTVKGNSTESVGTPASVEVLWETDNTSGSIPLGDIISNVQLVESSRITFEASGKGGNALIAVKDDSDVILWSWHIWSTDYDPEETAQTYRSGAVMMDRNLGALSVERGDVLSWGLFYQQGRKDPFVGCGDINAKTFATTVPSNVISYSSSGGDDFIVQNPCSTTMSYSVSWSDEKGLNDPCPPGWKVPAVSAYDGFTDGDTSVSYSMVFTSPLSSPDAYFPLTGDTEQGEQSLRNPGTTSYMWTTHNGYAYCIHSGSEQSRSKYDENPVRCQKETE